MASLSVFALLAILSSPGQPVLLDFYSDTCGPCLSMEPTVRRLMAEGYAVRPVNVAREPQLVQQFRVDRLPTFVLVADEREVARQIGPVSYDRLRAMFASVPSAASAADGPPAQPPSRTPAVDAAPPAAPSSAGLNPQTRAMYATVRLRVEDPRGQSFGTGTIVDRHTDAAGEEALIMTCAHIFRDSEGRGKITVDLVAPGAKGPVLGQLISCDLKQDVALVSIRPGISLVPVAVAPAEYQIRPGDRVFSIGCDRGGQPSVHDSRVTSLNKYVGPANIETAGQPVIGRSGGGLFAADGQLIGVCNLADPKDNEGIYAALPLLQQSLDKIGLSEVYQRNAPQLASTRNAAPGSRLDRSAVPEPPPMAERMPRPPLDNRPPQSNPALAGPAAPLAAVSGVGLEDTEIICVIRSKTNPNAPSEVLVVDRPPRELVDRLAKESQSRPGSDRDPVVLQAARSDSPLGGAAPARWADNPNRGPVVRGRAN